MALQTAVIDGGSSDIIYKVWTLIYHSYGRGNVVRISHPSFMDYITNQARSKELYVDLDQQDAMLARCCLETMMRELGCPSCALPRPLVSDTVVNKPSLDDINYVATVSIPPDGRRIVLGCANGSIQVWDTRMGAAGAALVKPGKLGYRMWSVAFSPDGRRIVSGSGGGTARVRDAETSVVLLEPLRGHSDDA
ncbi:hypothetical protein FRC06_001608 [Ceratobasidium sp. 370]|nr:hypothetical protein FRC06_001608 [Ceratobasidium sp. 370]